MATITIRIPEELLADLQKLSEKLHRSTSDVVRESLRRYISAEQLRLIREMTRPYAEAAGFFTDEDVFKAIS